MKDIYCFCGKKLEEFVDPEDGIVLGYCCGICDDLTTVYTQIGLSRLAKRDVFELDL